MLGLVLEDYVNQVSSTSSYLRLQCPNWALFIVSKTRSIKHEFFSFNYPAQNTFSVEHVIEVKIASYFTILGSSSYKRRTRKFAARYSVTSVRFPSAGWL